MKGSSQRKDGIIGFMSNAAVMNNQVLHVGYESKLNSEVLLQYKLRIG